MSRSRPLVLATMAGLLNGLCWLPLGLGPIAPLFAFIWFRALRGVRTEREALGVGLTFGAVRYAVAGHFILSLVRYSALAPVLFLLYVLYIVPFALVESWGSFRLERWTRISRTVWAALLFTLLEHMRTLGDLSFPADLLTHDLAMFPAWLDWSGWLGPSSTTLLILCVGALLELAWETRGRPSFSVSTVAAALLVWLAPLASPLSDAKAPGSTLDVALVQTSFDVTEKLNPKRWPEIWQLLERLTLTGSHGADLAVWPESARPGAVVWQGPGPFSDPRMEQLSRDAGVPILYGCQIARVDGERVRLYNGAALAYPDGRPTPWYGKQKLLPFVEAVPYAAILGWDPARRASPAGDHSYLRLMGNFSAGPQPTVFSVGDARIGVLICYEGAYPELARRFKLGGVNLLAVLTDDAWWTGTLFPRWHAAMVAARAVETGTPIIRAANGGISSYTDATGHMRERTSVGEVAVRRVTVEIGGSGPTWYTRHGNVPLFLAGGALVAVLALWKAGRATGALARC